VFGGAWVALEERERVENEVVGVDTVETVVEAVQAVGVGSWVAVEGGDNV